MKCKKKIHGSKGSTKNYNRLIATNNISTTLTESKDTVKKSTQN